jgi:hypothetical protein
LRISALIPDLLIALSPKPGKPITWRMHNSG